MRKYVIFFILTWGLSGCISNVDSSKVPISGTYISHDGANDDQILLVKGDYSAEIITMSKTSPTNIEFHLMQEIRFTPDEAEMCGICETGNKCALIGCEFTSQYVKYRIKNTPTEFKFNKIDSVVANGVKLVDWKSFVNSSKQDLFDLNNIKSNKQPSEIMNDYKQQVINAVQPFIVIPDSVARNNKTIVDVQLDSDLNVTSVKIIKSSGNSQLDRNIKSAIMRFKKFPDIPEGGSYSDYQKLRLTFQVD
jgi:TonB family protein